MYIWSGGKLVNRPARYTATDQMNRAASEGVTLLLEEVVT
jgi:hypothetical protein